MTELSGELVILYSSWWDKRWSQPIASFVTWPVELMFTTACSSVGHFVSGGTGAPAARPTRLAPSHAGHFRVCKVSPKEMIKLKVASCPTLCLIYSVK